MLGRMVVVTLVTKARVRVENAGWCRPKERGAERMIASKTRLGSAEGKLCVLWRKWGGRQRQAWIPSQTRRGAERVCVW
jgi:hypothetical protein